MTAWPMLPRSWAGPSAGYVDCVRVRQEDVSSETLAHWRRVVTREEAERVDRFVRLDDQMRALAARAVLRILLARAVGDPVTLVEGTFGKPLCPGGPEFNLSHGGKLVLLGFTVREPVGIDVEPVASGAAWREVVTRLHPEERAAVEADEDREAAFLQIWTRKEAVAKATGLGFSVDPASWSVFDWCDWSVCDLAPGDGHVAAVAVQGKLGVRCWSF